jgi:hypothetical protein
LDNDINTVDADVNSADADIKKFVADQDKTVAAVTTAAKDTSDKLSTIGSRLDSIDKEEAAMKTDIHTLASAPAPVVGQTIVNVNVEAPKGVCERLFESIEAPILHRTFVRTRECWRNVRDQIPCNN